MGIFVVLGFPRTSDTDLPVCLSEGYAPDPTAMTTTDSTTADEPFNRDTFETELAELVDHARETGVDLRGAYDARSADDTVPDYTIEISAVTE